ncbi:MAG TPA: hypothetical protein VN678_11615 [Acidobacteriaceae bacterium]|nr:hypothetical protein [Acidobacteriaceae bacterium]
MEATSANAPESFRELQWFGYASIYVVFEIAKGFDGTGFPEFERFHYTRGTPSLQLHLFVLRLILFCVLAIWSGCWIEGTRSEAEIWIKHGVRPGTLTLIDTAAILGTALYLGLVLALVGNTIAICWVFSGAILCNIVTVGYANYTFSTYHSKGQTPRAYLRYWDCDDDGRLRPLWKSRQIWRLTVMFLSSCAVTLLAVKGHDESAYVLLIANIVVVEAVIWRWRSVRDREAQNPSAEVAVAKTRQPRADAEKSTGTLAWILASLPVFSFLGQFLFSRRDGTLSLMLHHPTVTYVDWVLVPFNFFAAKVIDWRKGVAIFIIALVSTCLTLATHALWQVQRLDPGHMITKTGVLLPAGWVHIGFSIAEMALLCAFVFCRRENNAVALWWSTIYFVAMFAAGTWIHHRVVLSDGCVFASGLVFLYVYPAIAAKVRAGKAN